MAAAKFGERRLAPQGFVPGYTLLHTNRYRGIDPYSVPRVGDILAKLVFVVGEDRDASLLVEDPPMVVLECDGGLCMPMVPTANPRVWVLDCGFGVVPDWRFPVKFQCRLDGAILPVNILVHDDLAREALHNKFTMDGPPMITRVPLTPEGEFEPWDREDAIAAEAVRTFKVPVLTQCVTADPLTFPDSLPDNSELVDTIAWRPSDTPCHLLSSGAVWINVTAEVTAAVCAGALGFFEDGVCSLGVGVMVSPMRWQAGAPPMA